LAQLAQYRTTHSSRLTSDAESVTVDDHVAAVLGRCTEAGQWATINNPSDEHADALTVDDAGRYRVCRRPVVVPSASGRDPATRR
jgi:hypothetical protein